MTYQQAGRLAVVKRIAGWVIFIPAVISTFISVLKFIEQHSGPNQGINAVVSDFFHVVIDMMRFNTPFLNAFWHNSPQPDFSRGLFASSNMLFWIIYILVFVGLALQASGARMSRQVKHVREGVEDQMVLEQARGDSGISRAQLEQRIVIPRQQGELVRFIGKLLQQFMTVAFDKNVMRAVSEIPGGMQLAAG